MGGVGYFSAVSNVVQHMLAEVFNDETFMEQYFAENSRRLGAAYAEFTGECGDLLMKHLATSRPSPKGLQAPALSWSRSRHCTNESGGHGRCKCSAHRSIKSPAVDSDVESMLAA